MSAIGSSVDITGIIVPASAKAGDVIPIGVKVKNKTSVGISVVVTVQGNAPINGSDGSNFIVIGTGQLLSAGEEYTFGTEGVMPNQAVILTCTAYLISPDWGWLPDADSSATIGLAADVPVWQKLATAPVSIAVITGEIGAWQKLATSPVTALVEAGEIGMWQKLATKPAVIEQGIDWDAFNLVAHVDFPETKTYKGNAQEVISTFQSLTILGSIDFIKSKLIEGFTAEFTSAGLIPISVDLYQGKSGLLTTTFIVKSVAGEKVSAAVAFPPLWGVILIAALILFVIIALTFLVVNVKDLVLGGLEKLGPTTTFLIAAGIVGVIGVAISCECACSSDAPAASP